MAEADEPEVSAEVEASGNETVEAGNVEAGTTSDPNRPDSQGPLKNGMAETDPSPEEVVSMGQYLGVSVEKGESYLMAVAKEAVIAPVLAPWQEMEDENGNPYFYNHRCATAQHCNSQQLRASLPDDMLMNEAEHSSASAGHKVLTASVAAASKGCNGRECQTNFDAILQHWQDVLLQLLRWQVTSRPISPASDPDIADVITECVVTLKRPSHTIRMYDLRNETLIAAPKLPS
eukprot:6079224-Pyramimonas_sp.AAC.1